MNRRLLLLLLPGLPVGAVVLTACLLRFDIDGLVFPRTPSPVAVPGLVEAFRLPGRDGAALVVHRVERAAAVVPRGCVVDFPGRGGGVDRAARERFPELASAGLVVYAVAYPGQDGAPGRARLAEVQALATAAVSTVIGICGRTRTVVTGRSLGAMVAAYAAGAALPAGLVIESAAPTLGAGIRGALREHPLLRPLAWLPVERFLARDYGLAEALPPELHAVLFQGDADTRTPLADLWPDPAGAPRPPIVVVHGGTHADTFLRAKPAMVAAMLAMIRGSEEAAAAGGDAD